MARIHSSGSIIGTMLDKYFEGRKERKDEEYRQDKLDLDTAGQKREATEWGSPRYYKPQFNDKGHFRAYQDDEQKRAQDIPILEGKQPSFFRTPPAGLPGLPPPNGLPTGPSAPPPVPPPQQVQGGGMQITASPDPVPAPPPQPLLKSQKQRELEQPQPVTLPSGEKAKIAPNLMEADSMELGPIEKDPATGQPTRIAKKSSVSFDEANVTGTPPAPPAPPAPAPGTNEGTNEPARRFEPSGDLLGKIAELATTHSAKDSDAPIPLAALPEAWQRELLGLVEGGEIDPQELRKTLPVSMWREILQEKIKGKARGGADQVRPNVAASAQAVLGGKMSMSEFFDAHPDLSKAERKLFDTAFGAGQTNARQDKTVSPEVQTWADGALEKLAKGQIDRSLPKGVPMTPGNKEVVNQVLRKQGQLIQEQAGVRAEKKFDLAQNQLSPKAEEQIKSLEELKSYVEDASRLARTGNVRPRVVLDLARRMNATGGTSLEATNFLLDAIGESKINDDEAQFLKLISKSNIQELVKSAGTTFTEGFLRRIDNLGADVANPSRFRTNVAQILTEIDRQQSNVIRIGSANKKGNIQDSIKPSTEKDFKEEKLAGAKISETRTEKRDASETIKMIKEKFKGPEAERRIQGVKQRFQEVTGVPFDGK